MTFLFPDRFLAPKSTDFGTQSTPKTNKKTHPKCNRNHDWFFAQKIIKNDPRRPPKCHQNRPRAPKKPRRASPKHSQWPPRPVQGPPGAPNGCQRAPMASKTAPQMTPQGIKMTPRSVLSSPPRLNNCPHLGTKVRPINPSAQ